MINRLCPAAQCALVVALYTDEILAAPLLDADSPSPELRAMAGGHGREVWNRASFYPGATPAYLLAHRVRLYHLDAPCTPALLKCVQGINYVRVFADHLTWARFRIGKVEFHDCSLAVFLAAVRERAVPFHLSVNYGTLFAWPCDFSDAHEWTYMGAPALPQALLLGPRAFSGFECSQSGQSHTQSIVWLALGFKVYALEPLPPGAILPL